MKTILCYGDSNTYGYDPSTFGRYPKEVRWTGVLQQRLGSEWVLIEEGCNGRTGAYLDEAEPWLYGPAFARTAFYTHKPVDVFLLMLGTNDLKKAFSPKVREIVSKTAAIAEDILRFCDEKEMPRPVIYIISPIEVGEGIASSIFAEDFGKEAAQMSRELAPLFEREAARLGCRFFDAAKAAKPSFADSLHLSAKGHEALGLALAEDILNLQRHCECCKE